MTNQKIVMYLMRSAVAGGILGTAHGALVAYKHPEPKYSTAEVIINNGITGMLMGPWAPIAIPIWMWNHPDVRCPMNPRRWRRRNPPSDTDPPAEGATVRVARLSLDGNF
jgi:hypothetical protein